MAKGDSCDVVDTLLLGLWNIVIFSPTIPAEEGLRDIEGVEYIQFKPPATTCP